MTLRGVAYELPTWEPHTGGSGCSSSHGLLPTPLANDFSDDISTLEERKARGYGNHLRDLPLMLPSP